MDPGGGEKTPGRPPAYAANPRLPAGASVLIPEDKRQAPQRPDLNVHFS